MSKGVYAIIAIVIILLVSAFLFADGWALFVAAIGGIVVFLGLWIEHEADKEEKKEHLSNFTDDVRRVKVKGRVGWWILMVGIGIEIFIAAYEGVAHEIQMRQIKKEAAKNAPLNQPVSQVFAILRLVVDAKDYNPKRPIDLADSGFSFGDFALQAKEARWFEHIDYPSQKIAFYEIAIRFEQNILPSGVWNDINSTNPEIRQLDIPVTNAFSQASKLDAYIGFISNSVPLIKGSSDIYINGFRRRYLIDSNSVNWAMGGYNSDRHGVFLTITNSIP